MRATAATVDLGAVARNYARLVARAASGCAVAGVVKADAYGLGAGLVSRTLWSAGCRDFFVATAAEGAALRGILGAGARIFVLNGPPVGPSLIPVVSTPAQWRACDGPVALQVETGMHRLGVAPDEARGMLCTGRVVLLLSHLACADNWAHPLNAAQCAAFAALTKAFPDVPASLAASHAFLANPATHHALARCGIALYGGCGAEGVLALHAPVLQTATVPAGASIGYGATYRFPKDARVATVALGYADGLLRAASNRAALYHNGVPCPVRGRVSMDLTCVEVTHLGRDPDVMEVLGPHQGIDALAAGCGTIPYEVLTALGPGSGLLR
ncbi:MAG TPA: alanine racemase [Rhodospirillaceae bacterium]|jgi:alanine racemase|nr:alanine racemase [Alphaproteobacteria bacterium]HBH27089.1 alanine racemase [Rhodospirillaceae bacterium]